MPTMTPQERAKHATAKRIKNARDRRFKRYAIEMAQAPIPHDVLCILAEELRAEGWQVTAPEPQVA